MYVLAILSEKGGVGKTTLALDLAVAAGRRGQLATIIDLDPQATAMQWTDRRKADTPWVLTSPITRLAAVLAKAKTEGVEMVVLDTPPKLSMDSAEAAKRADLVLVPVEPHAFSLETVVKMTELLKYAGNPPSVFVINKAPVQGGEAEIAIKFLKGQGLEIAPAILHARAIHRHATNGGKVAAELDAHSRAAEEAEQLSQYIFNRITTRRNNGK